MCVCWAFPQCVYGQNIQIHMCMHGAWVLVRRLYVRRPLGPGAMTKQLNLPAKSSWASVLYSLPGYAIYISSPVKSDYAQQCSSVYTIYNVHTYEHTCLVHAIYVYILICITHTSSKHIRTGSSQPRHYSVNARVCNILYIHTSPILYTYMHI